ncbi:MAG: hypothetical protein NXI24_12960 [bacterium]|nr:hypothetical protein [bacterium]
MTALRILLLTMTAGIVAYTGVAGVNHGWDLLSVFLGNLTALNWSGQFNFDFMCYLILSALWLAWRHEFTPGGIALAAAASVLGILLFAPYLLWAISRSGGDMRVLLLGPGRAGA